MLVSGCSRVHAVTWGQRPVSVTWSVVNVLVLKAIEAGVVTSVRWATTVSRAVCRVIVTCLAVSRTSVRLTSASVMTAASVHARCCSYFHHLSLFIS